MHLGAVHLGAVHLVLHLLITQVVLQAILATEPSQAAVQLAQLLGPRAQGTAAQAAGHVQHDILEASQQLREELGERAGQLLP